MGESQGPRVGRHQVSAQVPLHPTVGLMVQALCGGSKVPPGHDLRPVTSLPADLASTGATAPS